MAKGNRRNRPENRLYGNRWHDATWAKRIKERNKTIRARRRKGETLQSIADAFGLSRQRIHQICDQEKP